MRNQQVTHGRCGNYLTLSVRGSRLVHSYMGRVRSQMRNLPYAPRHVKNRRSWVALLAQGSVPAAVYVVFANVVFAGKRVFEITCAFMQRTAFWAASLSGVHTRSHLTLPFNYA
jgi:hypothetical protein